MGFFCYGYFESHDWQIIKNCSMEKSFETKKNWEDFSEMP